MPDNGAPQFDPSAVPRTQAGIGSTVYWGQDYSTYTKQDEKTGAINPRLSKSVTKPIDEAKAQFFNPDFMSEQDRAQLGQALYRAGVISNPGDVDQIASEWSKAVDEAAMRMSFGQKITPYGVLQLKMHYAAGANGLNGGAKTTRNTYSNVTIPSPLDLEGIVKSVFQKGIGRDPTDSELKKYSMMIAGVARKNPAKGTQTTTTDGKGNTTTTTTGTDAVTGGGLQQAALDQIQGDPEYGAYQAATTYFNALMGVLGSPV